MRSAVTALLCLLASGAMAQQWMYVHEQEYSTPWTLPLMVDSIEDIRVDEEQKTLLAAMHDGFVVPLQIENIDSISFEEIIEAEEKNKYQVFQLFIYTENGQSITSNEEYIPCYVAVNGGDSYASRWQHAGIRGRGNSTWAWYEKKPYRIRSYSFGRRSKGLVTY